MLYNIVVIVDIGINDNVIEIGFGIGVLIEYLVWVVYYVLVFEIDDWLLLILDEILVDYDNVMVVN